MKSQLTNKQRKVIATLIILGILIYVFRFAIFTYSTPEKAISNNPFINCLDVEEVKEQNGIWLITYVTEMDNCEAHTRGFVVERFGRYRFKESGIPLYISLGTNHSIILNQIDNKYVITIMIRDLTEDLIIGDSLSSEFTTVYDEYEGELHSKLAFTVLEDAPEVYTLFIDNDEIKIK